MSVAVGCSTFGGFIAEHPVTHDRPVHFTDRIFAAVRPQLHEWDWTRFSIRLHALVFHSISRSSSKLRRVFHAVDDTKNIGPQHFWRDARYACNSMDALWRDTPQAAFVAIDFHTSDSDEHAKGLARHHAVVMVVSPFFDHMHGRKRNPGGYDL